MTSPRALALIGSIAMLGPWPAAGRDAADGHWLATRAATSDVVALVQLEHTDYEYERDIPVAGRAWLRPLIGYKPTGPSDGVLIVVERGLDETACYFPRPAPWNERPRYLVFLVEADGHVLAGHPEGCAVEMLVDADGGYAARWPQPAFGGEHGRGDAALQQRVEQMTFQGPGARIDAGDLLAHQRRTRAERDFMELDGTVLAPTRGIELTELRRLMQPGLEDDSVDAAGQGRSRTGSPAKSPSRPRGVAQRLRGAYLTTR